MKPLRLLTIAGSDSGGGAGIQADLKTFQALGGYGMSVITAVTAQNTCGVRSVQALDPSLVAEQLHAVLSDIGADAVKMGMLHNTRIIQTVASVLKAYDIQKIILDPVMVAKDGTELLEEEAIAALKEYLMPLATLVTPNIPEAQILTRLTVNNRQDMENAAQILLQGVPAVLLKGGHLPAAEEAADLLAVRKEKWQWFTEQRIATRNTHGTGCTYSAALAVYLGFGCTLPEAVTQARFFLQQAIISGASLQIGQGKGPVDHLWQQRRIKA